MVRHFPILENSETELSVDPRNGRRNNTTRSALLGPTVHKKIEYQNLKGDVFFAGPFNCLHIMLSRPLEVPKAPPHESIRAQSEYRVNELWLY